MHALIFLLLLGFSSYSYAKDIPCNCSDAQNSCDDLNGAADTSVQVVGFSCQGIPRDTPESCPFVCWSVDGGCSECSP